MHAESICCSLTPDKDFMDFIQIRIHFQSCPCDHCLHYYSLHMHVDYMHAECHQNYTGIWPVINSQNAADSIQYESSPPFFLVFELYKIYM